MKNIFSIFILSLSVAGCTSSSSKEEVSTKVTVIGTYDALPQRGDTVLYDTLINQLKDLHCNAYTWLIMPDTNSVKNKSVTQLEEFLPIAKKNNIEVWALLIPPVELAAIGGKYPTDDMRVWAAELAGLSVTYSNFKAWTIDDFTHSAKLYTTQYVSEFQNIAKKINPNFKFYPVCYFKESANHKFADAYGPLIDGIWFPYRNESVKADLVDPSHVIDEVNELRDYFGKNFPICLAPYSSRHSKLGIPTADYVSKVIKSGFQCADGIMIFRHPNPVKDAEKYQTIKTAIEKGLEKK